MLGYCFCFRFWFFWLRGKWDPPLPGLGPSPALESEVSVDARNILDRIFLHPGVCSEMEQGSGLEAEDDGRLPCPFLLVMSKDFGITEAEAGETALFLLSGTD